MFKKSFLEEFLKKKSLDESLNQFLETKKNANQSLEDHKAHAQGISGRVIGKFSEGIPIQISKTSL